MHSFICLEVCSVNLQDDRLIVYLIDLSAARLFLADITLCQLSLLAAATQGSHMNMLESS